MKYDFRIACSEDVAACLGIRGRTRHNALSVSDLEALGITLESWRAGVESGMLFGHVCTLDGRIAGYCFGHRDTAEIVVLAVLPNHEGNGVGKNLLNQVASQFRELGYSAAWLGASGNTSSRSHGFYRHLGWLPNGATDTHGDQVLEIGLG